MARNMQGFVRGGIQGLAMPKPIELGDLKAHTVGRIDTMAEVLTHGLCLKAHGFAKQATGYGKAVYQDVKGSYDNTHKVQAAHRSLFSLHLDGRDVPELTQVAIRKRLHTYVKAPYARTDLVIRPVNYADQLLENAISPDLFLLLRAAIDRQRVGQPVEKNFLIHTTFNLQKCLHAGFDLAIDSFEKGMQRRGCEELPVRDLPARVPQLLNIKDAEIDAVLDRAPWGIHVGGPATMGDLPRVILGTCQDINDRATPDITKPGVVDEAIETMTELMASKEESRNQ